MKAATWYLEQGVPVYLPITKNGPIDFVIDKRGKLLRVQVKTAAWVKNNHSYRYLQVPTRSPNTDKKLPIAAFYDILFVVGDRRFWEIPACLLSSGNIVLDGEYKRKRRTSWDAYEIQP